MAEVARYAACAAPAAFARAPWLKLPFVVIGDKVWTSAAAVAKELGVAPVSTYQWISVRSERTHIDLSDYHRSVR